MSRNKQHNFSGKLIWLVNDSDVALKGWKILLEEAGATVETFSTPEEAAATFRTVHVNSRARRPNLIVTDYVFSPAQRVGSDRWRPEETGINDAGEVIISAVREGEQSSRKTPVIIYTGRDDLGFRSFPGVDVTVLVKGGPPDKLLDLIDHTLVPSARRQ